MSPFQLGAALALLAAALLAVSAHDLRWILAGLVVTIGLASIVADPLPSIVAVGLRLGAGLLGAELLLLAQPGSAGRLRGSSIGPVAPGLAAAAAFVIGSLTSGVGSPANGPAVATAAGLGLLAIALGPLLLGRDVVRVGLGLTLLMMAAELIRGGLAGTPGPLEQTLIGALTVAILGVTAALVSGALRAGRDLSMGGGSPRETLFEAHPLVTAARSATGAETPREVHRDPRPGRGRPPAAGPRRDAAAHQLTLEERLRREIPARDAEPQPAPEATGEPATSPPAGQAKARKAPAGPGPE